jgi:uncharacterized membrane protein YhaH (DUF805 family)
MRWYLDAFKRYFDFDGRSRRKEFWVFAVTNAIVSFGLIAIGNRIHTQLPYDVYLAAACVPSMAVWVRRLHDTGHSSYWFLLIFLPVVGVIILFVSLCSDSDGGMNRYGPSPKTLPPSLSPSVWDAPAEADSAHQALTG